MFQRMTSSNEIIGLTMMLLMAMALVASQADAKTDAGLSAMTAVEYAETLSIPNKPFKATIEGHFNGKVLTVSIDTMAHFGEFRIDRD